jgi:hypothetical protein
MDKVIAYICCALLFFFLGMDWQSYTHHLNEAKAKEVHCGAVSL